MNRKKTFLLIISILSIVLFILYLSESSLFYLTKIEIYGNNEIVKEDIIEKIEKFKNEPIAYVNSSMLESSILKDARVQDVDVRKKYPSTLIVTINERKPSAFINLGKLYLIDNNLNVFAYFSETISKDYVIVDSPIDDIDRKNLSKILKVLEKSKLYELSSELKRYEKYYQIILKDGVRVYLDQKISEKKLNNAYIMYEKETKDKNIEYIDLRFNSKIIIK
ncbi:cell division protein FtsQ/DivIB [Oceanivirga miroungae]|uniref:Polypeptide-transport-associated domain-containing protein n=1 Tax=Oceanivirga miroungae TaxID=1130046 RepID=A0A6I8MEC0_9FUSO|nr:FtsQ-type POTRA domain-containing protein [Oceanivirga miroungae]VWL85933.1 polypeptide-transport-associated domain-containing protein [Oceanivirga miroungae]